MYDFLRKYLSQFIIGICVCVGFAIFLNFMLPYFVSSFRCLDTQMHSNVTELVYSSSVTYSKDCFVNLNGVGFIETDEYRLNCDTFMTLENGEYKDNFFKFKNNKLKANEAVVSKNLLQEYELKVGDTLMLKQYDEPITIVGKLVSQSGIDDKYNHKGVVILGHIPTYKKVSSYLTFGVDNDVYMDVINKIPRSKFIKDSSAAFVIEFFLIIGVVILAIAIIEISCQLKRYKHIGFLIRYGCLKRHILLETLLDNSIKYVIPIIIASLFTLINLAVWGFAYTWSVVIIVAVTVLAVSCVIVGNIWRALLWNNRN